MKKEEDPMMALCIQETVPSLSSDKTRYDLENELDLASFKVILCLQYSDDNRLSLLSDNDDDSA